MPPCYVGPVSEINTLIVKAFVAWKKRSLPPRVQVEIYHVSDFFHGLCDGADVVPIGTWETVCGAIRQAGHFEPKGDHVSICGIYLGRPEGRAAWERWRASRRARVP